MVDYEQLGLLKKSVKQWNKWRKRNFGVGVNLRGANLNKANLIGANLSKANLIRANLIEANLIEANLSRANLSIADLSGANLSIANLSGANLSGANLGIADLSVANLSGANLSGIDLSRTNLSITNLSGANLIRANLNGIDLSRVDLSEADLTEANLSRVDLSEADLTAANLSRVDLSEADLTETNLSRAGLRETNLSRVDFRETNLSEVDLRKANLREGNLSEVNLSNFDLSGADFTKANLIQVQALNTNFQNANLTGACIQNWNINSETNFDNVICDYIYLKHEYQENKLVFTERRPHNPSKNFAPGDFARLIQQASASLDLIFSKGIDWAAFSQTFQGLQIQTGSDELFVQAIEKKRDGSFVVKVDTPPSADKAALEKEFWARYQPLLEAKEAEYRALLQEKEIEHQQQRIQDFQHHNTNITEIVKMLGNRTINVEAKAVTGDNINQKGNFVAGVQKGGTIQGTVQIIENLNNKETFAEIAVDIQQLLAQLETQGFSPQGAKNKVATDLATQANENPEFKNKLAQWGKYVADAAANGMIGSGVVEVIKLALGFLV